MTPKKRGREFDTFDNDDALWKVSRAAGTGAALGAGLGYLLGGPPGAAIGGGAGALLGATYEMFREERKRAFGSFDDFDDDSW